MIFYAGVAKGKNILSDYSEKLDKDYSIFY